MEEDYADESGKRKLEVDYDKIKQIYTSLDDYISSVNGAKESILNLSYTERGERLC